MMKRKQEEWKKMTLKLIEKAIEETVTPDWLVDACQSLTQSEYDDIVTERVVTKQCGYPLCQTPLTKVSNQKYRICAKTNRVYDITERKQFCSDWCYKASTFLKKQLHVESPWLQEDRVHLNIAFLQRINETGDQGEEVDFGVCRLTRKDLEPKTAPKPKDINPPQAKARQNVSAPYISKDQLEKLSDQVKHLTITETPIVHQEMLSSIQRKQKEATRHKKECRNNSRNHEENIIDASGFGTKDDLLNNNDDLLQSYHSSVSREDTEASEEHYGEQLAKTLTEKLTLLQNDRDAVKSDAEGSGSGGGGSVQNDKNMDKTPLAAADDDNETTDANTKTAGLPNMSCAPKTKYSASKAPKIPQKKLIDKMKEVFSEWVTPRTLEYLLGEEEYSLMLKREKLTCHQACVCDIERMQIQFAHICKKLDQEELEDQKYDLSVLQESKRVNKSIKSGVDQKSEASAKQGKKKQKAANCGRKKSFEDNLKSDLKKSDTIRDPVLPTIHSHSQMTMRKKLVSGKLQSVYQEILLPVGIPVADVLANFQELISTFTFSAHNVSFKVAEWTFIAIFILKMLSKQNISIFKALKEEQVQMYISLILQGMQVSVEEVDKLLESVLNPHSVFK